MEIQDFPNYLIYPDGRVWSKKSNKYLKSRKNNNGYDITDLYYDIGKKTTFLIHRLVAIHYIDNPDNLNEVDHINRIKDDNRVENLRWVTHLENMSNLNHRKSNTSGFDWIVNDNSRGSYIYTRRMYGKRINKRSKDLSKLLCYSFFYILKKKY